MTNNFFYSVVLVLIAQIPLLLKLYLDYKSKKDALKQKLFDKQMEAYIDIYKQVSTLHHNLYLQLSIWKYAASGDELWLNSERELFKGSHDTLVKFSEAILSQEFLLPASIVGRLAEYKMLAYKILGSSIRSEHGAIKEWKEVAPLWDEQMALFNILTNEMRMRLGIDALSNELTKLLEVKGNQQLIMTQMKVD